MWFESPNVNAFVYASTLDTDSTIRKNLSKKIGNMITLKLILSIVAHLRKYVKCIEILYDHLVDWHLEVLQDAAL